MRGWFTLRFRPQSHICKPPCYVKHPPLQQHCLKDSYSEGQRPNLDPLYSLKLRMTQLATSSAVFLESFRLGPAACTGAAAWQSHSSKCPSTLVVSGWVHGSQFSALRVWDLGFQCLGFKLKRRVAVGLAISRTTPTLTLFRVLVYGRVVPTLEPMS